MGCTYSPAPQILSSMQCAEHPERFTGGFTVAAGCHFEHICGASRGYAVSMPLFGRWIIPHISHGGGTTVESTMRAAIPALFSVYGNVPAVLRADGAPSAFTSGTLS